MIEERKGKITVNYYGKEVSIEFDLDLDTYTFAEEVLAPLMIGMGYFPTNVYKTLGLQETLDVIKEALERDDS